MPEHSAFRARTAAAKWSAGEGKGSLGWPKRGMRKVKFLMGKAEIFTALRTKTDRARACLVAFDLLNLNCEDLRQRPLEARRGALSQLVSGVVPPSYLRFMCGRTVRPKVRVSVIVEMEGQHQDRLSNPCRCCCRYGYSAARWSGRAASDPTPAERRADRRSHRFPSDSPY